MAAPREIGAADFKARCLEIIDEVERLGTEVVITRHRKPVARLVPVQDGSTSFCGSLRGMILEEGDLISPIDVSWEFDESNLT
ncbi:MAG TPA: type II toxin-antitoxin system Phd/YefM family antitoxin [Candidatus Cybelea sp.]|nr:type II toxin-antitoxin system Phd/YefM family antitoxin [Candidatus Cybelea sp.]